MLKDKTDDITKTINLHFDSSAVTTVSNYRIYQSMRKPRLSQVNVRQNLSATGRNLM